MLKCAKDIEQQKARFKLKLPDLYLFLVFIKKIKKFALTGRLSFEG